MRWTAAARVLVLTGAILLAAAGCTSGESGTPTTQGVGVPGTTGFPSDLPTIGWTTLSPPASTALTAPPWSPTPTPTTPTTPSTQTTRTTPATPSSSTSRTPTTPTVPTRTVPTRTVPTRTTLTGTPATPPPTPTSTAAPTTPGGISFPRTGLPGVNDPTCSSDEPPVLLLHGTVSTAAGNFQQINAALQAQGRCVYALTYGQRYGFGGLAPVRTSSEQVAAFAEQVLAVTGAEQLDIVAYSQGALVARTMLSGLTGPDLDPAVVRSLVMVAPNYHGTTSAIATNVPAELCASCADQVAGSALLQELAVFPELAGDVRYAVVSTRNDLVVTPVSAQVPVGPPDRVTSVVLEEECRLESDHLDVVHELPVARWVAAAVASGGRPDAADLGC